MAPTARYLILKDDYLQELIERNLLCLQSLSIRGFNRRCLSIVRFSEPTIYEHVGVDDIFHASIVTRTARTTVSGA